MTTTVKTSLKERVTTLEKDVVDLKQRLEASQSGQPGPNDWQKSVGRFKDDPTYEEAVRLGRAWRRRQPKC